LADLDHRPDRFLAAFRLGGAILMGRLRYMRWIASSMSSGRMLGRSEQVVRFTRLAQKK
jgi:hypothetical protein